MQTAVFTARPLACSLCKPRLSEPLRTLCGTCVGMSSPALFCLLYAPDFRLRKVRAGYSIFTQAPDWRSSCQATRELLVNATTRVGE